MVVVTGQVTDAVGSGLVGVSVVLYRRSPDGSRGPRLAETRTTRMGDFSLNAFAPIHGDVLVVFTGEHYAELTRSITLSDSGKPPFLGVSLDGNLVLTGRVIHDSKQKPIAGAKVLHETAADTRMTSTDEGGNFSLRGLSPGNGRLVAVADGFGRQTEQIQLPATEEVVLRLKPERIIHLSVVDDAGQPVPGVALECLDEPRSDRRSVVTTPEGRADLRGISFDAHRIAVRHDHLGFVPSEGFGEKISLPLLEFESSHKIVLVRAATVVGRVFDADSGEPLLGARVIAGDRLTDFVPRTWSDSDGRFTLPGVRPGTVAVTASLDNHAPELALIEAKPSEQATVELRLAKAAEIRGTVRNQTGEPIAGAEVVAEKWRDRNTLGIRAMTDRDGAFVLRNAPRDSFEFSILSPGASPFRGVADASASTPLEIILREGAGARTLGGQAMLKPGDAVPTVKLRMLDGSPFDFSSLRGKTVLVVFWATWCGPCLAEVPNLVAVHEKYRGRKDFIMIGVSRDYEESALRDFLKANPKVVWPQAYGEAGGVPAAVEAFGVWSIPAIFLIGPDGKIAASQLFGQDVGVQIERVLKVVEPQ